MYPSGIVAKRTPRRLLRLTTATAIAVATTAAVATGLSTATTAQALPSNPRTFSCTGSLGEAFTERTVTGKLSAAARPYQVQVVSTATGTVDSSRTSRAVGGGASWLHPGYVDWDVTGHNPDGNLYRLHLPPVLPGAGGFHDADLEILFAGGTNGSWQIPMFDCTITGGAPQLAHPKEARTFTCTGSLGEAYTRRAVTGVLDRANVPTQVTVTETTTGTVASYRPGRGRSFGPSWLHHGYVDWNVTGANPDQNLYHVHLPPVLPRAGGFHDADLEILFAGGANGSWQIPMFDCVVG